MYDPYVREIAVPIEESSVHVPPTEPAAPLSGHLLEVVSGGGVPEEESSVVIDGMIAIQKEG